MNDFGCLLANVMDAEQPQIVSTKSQLQELSVIAHGTRNEKDC